jgi:HAD superfamily hydrolase (TIGR01509 family)
VVFDVGNTLWFQARRPHIDEIVRLQAAALHRQLTAWDVALPCTAGEIVRSVHAAGDAFERRERRRGSLREVDGPPLLREALARRGTDISELQSAELWHATWVLERHFGVQLYPDTLDVLAALKAHGLLVGINTNRPCTAATHLPGLRDFGIAPYIDAVVCSGDTGYVKPHPSTFELVLERLGVSAPEAAMVGDTAAADMRGAKAVGMRTVWKLNGRYDLSPCADADYAIHDLAELLTLPLVPRRTRHAVAGESRTPHEDNNENRY